MAQSGDRITHPTLQLAGTVQAVKPDGALDVLWDDGSRHDIGGGAAPAEIVGRRVQHPTLAMEGTVMTVRNGEALVQWDDGTSYALPASRPSTGSETSPERAETVEVSPAAMPAPKPQHPRRRRPA